MTVTNVGRVAGAEVAQIYVQPPQQPGLPVPRWNLVGFEKCQLAPAATARLAFRVSAQQLSVVQANGTRVLPVAASYVLTAGGHHPEDPLGPSNVLRATFDM